MYAKGIEMYCAPTADCRETWIASMRHIAVEGRCFVLACNQFNRRRDFPSDYHADLGEDPDRIVTKGGSCIVDPFCNFLAGPYVDGEVILTAEIDLGQIIQGKYDLDVVGHYARPDIFQLHVDERPKRPVTTSTDFEDEALLDSKKRNRLVPAKTMVAGHLNITQFSGLVPVRRLFRRYPRSGMMALGPETCFRGFTDGPIRTTHPTFSNSSGAYD